MRKIILGLLLLISASSTAAIKNKRTHQLILVRCEEPAAYIKPSLIRCTGCVNQRARARDENRRAIEEANLNRIRECKAYSLWQSVSAAPEDLDRAIRINTKTFTRAELENISSRNIVAKAKSKVSSEHRAGFDLTTGVFVSPALQKKLWKGAPRYFELAESDVVWDNKFNSLLDELKAL